MAIPTPGPCDVYLLSKPALGYLPESSMLLMNQFTLRYKLLLMGFMYFLSQAIHNLQIYSWTNGKITGIHKSTSEKIILKLF